MTNTQYTQGPWVIRPDNGIETKDGETVASFVDNAQHAHLIAAAPAMYEALVETMKVLRSLRDNKEEWYTLVTPELLTAWDKNKAVLAQADGEGILP